MGWSRRSGLGGNRKDTGVRGHVRGGASVHVPVGEAVASRGRTNLPSLLIRRLATAHRRYARPSEDPDRGARAPSEAEGHGDRAKLPARPKMPRARPRHIDCAAVPGGQAVDARRCGSRRRLVTRRLEVAVPSCCRRSLRPCHGRAVCCCRRIDTATLTVGRLRRA